jgi:radical SAM protein with 4Fe4S-binding SPASM domain
MKLQDDLFIIRYKDNNIVYSPLRRALFFADNDSVETIERYLNNELQESDKNTQVWGHITQLEEMQVDSPQPRQINKGGHVIIIPTQICNLGCTYCYAREAHSRNNMSTDILKTILDFVLNSPNRKKSISFIGGGEPLVSWDLIRWSVEYLEQNKKTNDILNIGITTNATLFTEEMFQYVKVHGIHIGVSYEILADIQNSQRPFLYGDGPTFDVVDANIKKLIQYDIPYSIRSTITKLNVKRMPEMVDFVAKHYPNLKKLHLEQVTDPSEDDASFYSDFINYFYEAKEIGKQNGIFVYNSISKSIHSVKKCFCPGELCVTPTGSIVACHRVSSEQESFFPLFYYGKVNNSLLFDQKAENSFLEHTYKKREECKQCFAYWHCAGICPMERVELSEEQIKAKCDFVKTIITRELYETLLNGLKK